MFSRRAAVPLTVLLLNSACSAVVSPLQRPLLTGRSLDQNWSSVVEVVEENKWPVRSVDVEGGVLVSEWVRIRPEEGFVDCGPQGVATDYNHTGELRISLRRAARGAPPAFWVETRWTAVRELNDVTTPLICQTTGRLEAIVYHQLEGRLETEGLLVSSPR